MIGQSRVPLVVDPSVSDPVEAYGLYLAECERSYRAAYGMADVMSPRWYAAPERVRPAVLRKAAERSRFASDLELGFAGNWATAKQWVTGEFAQWIEESGVQRVAFTPFRELWAVERERAASREEAAEMASIEETDPLAVASRDELEQIVRELAEEVGRYRAGVVESTPVESAPADGLRGAALAVDNVTPKMADRLCKAVERGDSPDDAVTYAVGTLKGRRAVALLEAVAAAMAF